VLQAHSLIVKLPRATPVMLIATNAQSLLTIAPNALGLNSCSKKKTAIQAFVLSIVQVAMSNYKINAFCAKKRTVLNVRWDTVSTVKLGTSIPSTANVLLDAPLGSISYKISMGIILASNAKKTALDVHLPIRVTSATVDSSELKVRVKTCKTTSFRDL
jgi:hypothetical protein